MTTESIVEAEYGPNYIMVRGSMPGRTMWRYVYPRPISDTDPRRRFHKTHLLEACADVEAAIGVATRSWLFLGMDSEGAFV